MPAAFNASIDLAKPGSSEQRIFEALDQQAKNFQFVEAPLTEVVTRLKEDHEIPIVVDERALIDALREGRVSGAALDVFEDEPLPEDSPLRRMSNVLLAPHNANSSPAAWARVHESTLGQVLAALAGTPR